VVRVDELERWMAEGSVWRGTGGQWWSRLAGPSQAELHLGAGKELFGGQFVGLGEDVVVEGPTENSSTIQKDGEPFLLLQSRVLTAPSPFSRALGSSVCGE
jgi:hypothetical protein